MRPRRTVLLLTTVLAVLAAVVGTSAGAATAPSFSVFPGSALGDVLSTHTALVDDDEVPDLVTAVVGKGFTVELGRGDGTFRAPVLTPVAATAYGIAVGDVDRDGRADVVVPVSGTPGRLHVLLGTRDGRGSFTKGPEVALDRGPVSALLLDADGDGDLDVAAPGAGNVAFLLGDGRGAFTPGPVVDTGVSNVYAPLAADFNGDAQPDLVLPRNGRVVTVLLSTGTAFGYRLVTTGATSALGVAVGQVTGDPAPEIAYAAGGTAGLLTYDPVSRAFRDRPLTTGLTGALGASVSDVDRDGDPDVGTTSGGQQVLLLAQADGSFTPWSGGVPVDANSYTQTAADVTSDGWTDIVVTSYGGRRNTVLTNAAGPAADRPPVLAQHPTVGLLKEGESYSLVAKAVRTGTVTVEWQRLEGSTWTDVLGGTTTTVDGTTTATLTGTARAAENGTALRAVFSATGADGRRRSASTDNALLTVRAAEAPSFRTPLPTELRFREGSDQTVTVVPAGEPAPTVRWEVLAAGSTSPQVLPDTSAALALRQVPLTYDGATLRVTLTNAAGTATSTAGLTVDPLPRITTEPLDARVRPGSGARFTAAHTGSGPPVWETSTDTGTTWTTVQGSGDTFELPTTTATQTGHRYRLRLTARGTTPAPVVTSRAALLTVDPAPEAPTALTATAAVDGSVTVRWQPPAQAADVTGYAVVFRGLSVDHPADARQVVFSSVPDGTHAVEVRALDALGEGAPVTATVVTPGTASPSASPSRSASPSPTASPRASASATPSASPRPSTSASASPSGTPSASPSSTPSSTPRATPSPSASRSASPSPSPSRSASPRPSAVPTRTTPVSATTPRASATPSGPAAPASPLPTSPDDLVPDATTGELRPIIRTVVTRIDGGKKSTIIGLAAPGTKLELLGYVRPATEYRVLRTGVADANGAFSFTTVPSGNMRAHVRTAGGTVSESVVQEVRPWLGLTAKSLGARSYSFTGSVTPRRPGQLVTLYVVSGAKRTLLANVRVDGKGVYYDEHRFTRPGAYRVVAVARRDLVTFEAQSPVRPVTVR